MRRAAIALADGDTDAVRAEVARFKASAAEDVATAAQMARAGLDRLRLTASARLASRRR